MLLFHFKPKTFVKFVEYWKSSGNFLNIILSNSLNENHLQLNGFYFFQKMILLLAIVSAPEIRPSTCNDCNVLSTNSESKLLYWFKYFRNVAISKNGEQVKPNKIRHKRYSINSLFSKLSKSRLLISLRILTGKKHPKIKLQRLQDIRIWTFGSLVH